MTGLIIINTGSGKGKTTAALGAAMRALGHGKRVLFLQFIKGAWKSGEHDSAEKLGSDIEIRAVGLGFVKPGEEASAKHIAAAKEGLESARKEFASGKWEMVVLDEVFAAVNAGLFSEDDVIEAISGRGFGVDLILTGRNATPKLAEMADTVSEFSEVKHPFTKGIAARKGIEY